MSQNKKIEKIQEEVIRQVQLGDYNKARQFMNLLAQLGSQNSKYQQLYEEQQAASQKLEEQIKELQEPPLMQGIILALSPDDEKNVIVGMGGQRLEIRLAPNSNLTRDELQVGLEAWLNQDRQIVKVREPYSSGEAGEITGILEDGRLEVKSRGNEGTVVDPLPGLANQKLQIGDRVRVDPHLAIAFEKLPHQGTKELELEHVPDVTYDDIGGLDDKIEQIRDAIELPYLYNKLFRRYHLRRPKGILLYGPPGCGKTMIAKAIANSLTTEISRNLDDIVRTLELLLVLRAETPADDNDNDNEDDALGTPYIAWQREVRDRHVGPRLLSDEVPTRPEIEEELLDFLDTRGVTLDNLEGELRRTKAYLAEGTQAYFMSIKGPELLNKYVGETEQSIRKLFLQAKRRASASTPVVMFFDEIEALFRRRGSRKTSDMESTTVPQFLSEIDGVEGLDNVVIIGATNRQELLDPAILRPGRLDIKIKIDRPKRDAAHAILGKYLTLELPIDQHEVEEWGSTTMAFEMLIEKTVSVIYHDESTLRASGDKVPGRNKTFPWKSFVSGAMLENIVNRAKKVALKRQIKMGQQGIRWSDLEEAVLEEFEENKDQLVATELQIATDELAIQVKMAERAQTIEVSPWLQPLARPWQRMIIGELNV